MLVQVTGVFRRGVSLCDKAYASMSVGSFHVPEGSTKSVALKLKTTVLRMTVRMFSIGNQIAEVNKFEKR